MEYLVSCHWFNLTLSAIGADNYNYVVVTVYIYKLEMFLTSVQYYRER